VGLDERVNRGSFQWYNPLELWQTVRGMAERKFIVLKYEDRVPMMAGCENCKRKFFTTVDYFGDAAGALEYLFNKFDHHRCEETTAGARRPGTSVAAPPHAPIKGTVVVDLTVVCNGCAHRIRIPLTAPSEKVKRQMSLTARDTPRNVLCPYCKLASWYPTQEFRPVEFENTDPNLSPGDRVAVCIEVRCADRSCESHVRLHSVMIESDDMRREASQMLSKSICTTVVCNRGDGQHHLLTDFEIYALGG
jgi:hypothetical protein